MPVAAGRTTATTSSTRTSASARSAATTFRSGRASGSSSSSTTGRSRRRPSDLRSEDPLGFFDLRPYTERLAEAEISTGLGDAMVIGARRDRERGLRARRHGLRVHGRLDGQRRRREALPRRESRRRAEGAARRRSPPPAARACRRGSSRSCSCPKTVCAIEDLRDARCGFISVMTPPDDGRRPRQLREPRRRHRLPSRGRCSPSPGPRVVQQTTREKLPGRLRPRRVQPPLRPPRRDSCPGRAAALPRPRSATLLQWPLKTNDSSASG